VTHALLYHYFPTKQALIDRVYLEVFEGRWQPEWETLLDDPVRSPEDKLTAFYAEYVDAALTREFVRILVFSGLTDHTITDRFFSLLRQRLFTRLIRETRRFRGVISRARPSERDSDAPLDLCPRRGQRRSARAVQPHAGARSRARLPPGQPRTV
jgi:AcrR family transcriptional regulator